MKRNRWTRFGVLFLALVVAAVLLQWQPIAAKAAPKVKSVKMNYTEYTLKKGKSLRLKATVKPKSAAKNIVWKSSKKSVATVTSKGVVKARKKGKTTITATIKGTKKKASCKITVGTLVKKVSVAQTRVDLKVAETSQIKVTLTPAKASNKKVSYTSSNTAVAKVTSNGLITAVAPGSAKITVQAKDGSKKKAKIAVTVTAKPTPVPLPTPVVPSEPETPEETGMVEVTSFAQMQEYLQKDGIEGIICSSTERGSFTIPEGDYRPLTLQINAPNATVTNKGIFEQIILEAIHTDTWIEQAEGNKITISAEKAHVVAEGSETFLTISEGAENVAIEQSGSGISISHIYIRTASEVVLTGENLTTIPVEAEAEGANLDTAIPVQLQTEKKIHVRIQPGAETSTISAGNEQAIPTMEGIGIISVANMETGEIKDVAVENKGTTDQSKRGILTGVITDGSQNVLEEAEVYVLPYSSVLNLSDLAAAAAQAGDTAIKTTTDTDGIYTTESLPYGNYAMIVMKDGMIPCFQMVVLTQEKWRSEPITLNEETTETGNITGLLSDAATGEMIPEGIDIYLRAGAGNVFGNILAQTQTAEDGTYELNDMTPGTYTVQIVDNRKVDVPYARNSFLVYIRAGITTEENMALSKQIEEEQIRFVLTWGAASSEVPDDLDIHLTGPSAEEMRHFHVYYGSKYYEEQDTRYVGLDVDDTSYEGPETITIYQKTDGIYQLYIHDWTDKSDPENTCLASSRAIVKVYRGQQNIATYRVPDGIGTLWEVCTYDTTTNILTPINTLSYYQGDTSNIGRDELEIAQEQIYKLIERYERKYYYGAVIENQIAEKIQALRDMLQSETNPERLLDYAEEQQYELSQYFDKLESSTSIDSVSGTDLKNDYTERQGEEFYNEELGEYIILQGYSVLTIYTVDGSVPQDLEIIPRYEAASVRIEDSDRTDYEKMLIVTNSEINTEEIYYIDNRIYNPSKMPTDANDEGNTIYEIYSVGEEYVEEEDGFIPIICVRGSGETLTNPQFIFEDEEIVGTYEPLTYESIYCGRLTVSYRGSETVYLIEYTQYIPEVLITDISQQDNVIFGIERVWNGEVGSVYMVYGEKEKLGDSVTLMLGYDTSIESALVTPDDPEHGEWNYRVECEYNGLKRVFYLNYQMTTEELIPKEGYVIYEEYGLSLNSVALVEKDESQWVRIILHYDTFSEWSNITFYKDEKFNNITYAINAEKETPVLEIWVRGALYKQYPMCYEKQIETIELNVEGDAEVHTHSYEWAGEGAYYMEVQGFKAEPGNLSFTTNVEDAAVTYEPVEDSEEGIGILTVTYLTQESTVWVRYIQCLPFYFPESATEPGNSITIEEMYSSCTIDGETYDLFYFEGTAETMGEDVAITFDQPYDTYRITKVSGIEDITHKVTITYKGLEKIIYLEYRQENA